MNEPLTARRLAMVPTTMCTLHCKLCGDFLNKVNRRDIPYEKVCADIDECFKIFDHIEWFQYVGGEIFIYKDMEKLFRYALKYKNQFDKLIIETNATVAPNEEEQAVLREYGKNLSVFISDYGKWSFQEDKFIDVLEKNHIDYQVKKYCGDNQYCSGWIDNTELRDLQEPEDVLEVNARNCPQAKMKNMHCYDGKLHRCSNSCFMTELSIFPPKDRDFVDLRDKSMSIEEKRDIIREFYNYPRQSCRFCKQKYMAVLPRYPAAEQLNTKK